VISSDRINKEFDTKAIDGISKNKIKTGLWPVLRKRDSFDLDSTKLSAKKYIKELMSLTKHEVEFLECFEKKEYRPELLFEDEVILSRINDHPMALWKTRK